MTTLREAAQQALEALETLVPTKGPSIYNSARDDRRAALAQQAPEPAGRVVSANCEYATVQWLKQTSNVGGGDPKNSRSWPIAGDAVYTVPPKRLPLTKESLLHIYNQLPNWGMDMDSLPQGLEKFARGVERAHGIKE